MIWTKIGTGHFSFGHNQNFIYVCTIKLYDILKVRNAPVKFVYFVSDYTICSLVFMVTS
jgi:hypothetical protein